MKKKLIFTLCILIFLLIGIYLVTSLSRKSTKYDSKGSQENTVIESVVLPIYIFHSSEEVEQITDEDLIFINQHPYKTKNFYDTGEFNELDLFGIELNKDIYETVFISTFELKDLEIDLDVSKPLPEEEFQRLIDTDIEMMYYYANTQKPGEKTGKTVVSKDTLFCGENNIYTEYSVRYTQRCTMYENNKLTSTNIPNAYRKVYLKNYIISTSENNRSGFLLGELSADYVKEQLDVFHSYDSNPIIFREVTEHNNRYTYSTYYTTFEYNDRVKNNVVILWNHKQYIYKDTHKVTSTRPSEIRRAEIPGTENDVEPVY